MKTHRQSPTPTIGIVGLGLMGRGIAASLIAHGYRVVGYDRSAKRGPMAHEHIDESLKELVRRKLLAQPAMKNWTARFSVASRLAGMAGCEFVIESVPEDLALKRRVYAQLERILSPTAVITSNTSSLPISLLQEGRAHPERFAGMHWCEPAHVMNYLEIVPGKLTSADTIERVRRIGVRCAKDPIVLNVDIRGFVANRMMYAMMREACYLVEAGVADIDTVDRAFQNDIGWWAALAGPFRWMDLTGIPAYAAVMEGLLPELSNATEVPKTMRDVLRRRARGISNGKGFYAYDPASAKQWEAAWVEFTYDMRKLVDKYDERLATVRGKKPGG